MREIRNASGYSLDRLKNINRETLEYSPSQGFLSLREKLVKYYQRFNIALTPDDIIVTSGGSEAVLFAFMTCLNPGDEPDTRHRQKTRPLPILR